jgi:hypothetical protein
MDDSSYNANLTTFSSNLVVSYYSCNRDTLIALTTCLAGMSCYPGDHLPRSQTRHVLFDQPHTSSAILYAFSGLPVIGYETVMRTEFMRIESILPMMVRLEARTNRFQPRLDFDA